MRILVFPQNIRCADNPYGELLYRGMPSFGIEVDCFSPKRALWGRYDIFHLHWPEYYLNRALPKALIGSFLVLLTIAWMRSRGTRILWTAHNAHSHALSHPAIETWFWRMFTDMLDGFVSLSEACAKRVKMDVPGLCQRESAVIPHGHYREAYPSAIDNLRARLALGLTPEQTVLLFFGGVAPYKNVPHLITTFRHADLPNTIMLVAGRPDSKHGKAVEMAAQGDPRIRLDLRHIPKEEARLLFSAADLVVLPFSDIMHSGSAILALSFNKPVLVPALGALPELQACVGKEWVQTYQGDLTPAILSAAAAWARNSDRGPCPDLSSFEWPHIVQATVALYSRLCALPLPLQQPDKGTETLKPAVLLNQLPPAASLIFKDPV